MTLSLVYGNLVNTKSCLETVAGVRVSPGMQVSQSSKRAGAAGQEMLFEVENGNAQTVKESHK
jgi:hypothetical protein